MSSRNAVTFQRVNCVLVEIVKFNVSITQNVRIWSKAHRVILKKTPENQVPIFLDEIDVSQVDP
jgi:hypothetical protein